MKFKRFMPGLHNLLPSFLGTFIFWIVKIAERSSLCNRVDCIQGTNPTHVFIEILPSCCGGYSYSMLFNELFFVIVLPFLALYIASSIIAMVYDANKVR